MKIKFQALSGYAYGAVQPSALFRFIDLAEAPAIYTRSLGNLLRFLPTQDEDLHFDADNFVVNSETIPSLLLRVIDILNRYCGDQRFTGITVFEEDKAIVYVIPTLAPLIAQSTLVAVLEFIKKTKGTFSQDDAIKFAEKLKAHCRRFLPNGTNAGNFIAAAAECKIPFNIFSTQYLVFGYGSGSSILNSSITDRESAIGVKLTKSKVDTNRLLKLSGIPVADQARVRSIDDAVRYANEFGYPVVLKPENEDQSRGVYANIIDEPELRECFKTCHSNYKSLILEKHIEGGIYRVNMFFNKAVRMVERIPPTLIGDGKNSVEYLIHQRNLEPIRSDINTTDKKTKIDDNLHRMLRNQKLTLKSILTLDQQILLSASLEGGGEPRECLDEIHTENLTLIINAVKTLRISIAGVDFISTDITKPWHTNGAVICEVNAQPQLGRTQKAVYSQLLNECDLQNPTIKIQIYGSQKSTVLNIFDKSKDQVYVRISPEEIFRNGCPTQYFNTLEIADDVSDFDRNKLKRMLISVMPELIEI
jgi:D-alanine-D-alanine ligase-like ATP-grasp enzyme